MHIIMHHTVRSPLLHHILACNTRILSAKQLSSCGMRKTSHMQLLPHIYRTQSYAILRTILHPSSSCKPGPAGHGIRSFDSKRTQHAVDPEDCSGSSHGVKDFQSLKSDFEVAYQNMDVHALHALVPRLEATASTPTDRLSVGLICCVIAKRHVKAEDPEAMSKVFFYVQRALAILQSLGRLCSWEHAICVYMLGCACLISKKFEDAMQHFEKAALFLKDFDAAKDQPTKEQATAVETIVRQEQYFSCVELLDYYSRKQEEDPAQATLALETALAIACTPPGQKDLAAKIEDKLGTLKITAGEAEKAFPYLQSSLAKKREIHGPESFELVTGLFHLALAYMCVGRPGDALEQFEAADMIFSRKKEVDHSIDKEASYLYANLGNFYSALGRLDDAIECQKTLIDLLKRGGENQGTKLSTKEAEQRLEALVQRAKPQPSWKDWSLEKCIKWLHSRD